MLLTITLEGANAQELGYLLAKHPDRCQTFSLAYGKAHVFYPEVSEDCCTAALLLDFDPVGLVRNHRWGTELRGTLAHYVNDRPYVVSSFFSVAIAQVFSSAMKGQCRERPELAEMALSFTATLASVPSKGGLPFLRALFEPLGYTIEAEQLLMDETFADWSGSPYYYVRLRNKIRLAELLSHLYVLLPVLDNEKHYWVGEDELEKLLSKGSYWLKQHPAKEEISKRYLKNRRSLFRRALEKLAAEDGSTFEEIDNTTHRDEESLEKPLSLNDQRLGVVVGAIKSIGGKRVIDLGCGEGKLINILLREKSIEFVLGVDVSAQSLELARDKLRLEKMPSRIRSKVDVIHGSLTYRDERFKNYDIACAIEVIEHLDISRLGAFERVVFEFAAPPSIIITTPNVEYNVKFTSLPAHKLRHRDHRFEWTRAEFRTWAQQVAHRHQYEVSFLPVGPVDENIGAPTQMAVFQR